MRKLNLILFVLLISIVSFSVEDIKISEDQLGEPMGWMIGLGAGYDENILKVDKSSMEIIPMIRYEGERYFVGPGATPQSMISLGGYLYRTDSFRFSAFYNPMAGFDIKRSDLDSGYGNLDKRETKSEIGIKLEKDIDWQNLHLETYGTYGEKGSIFGAGASKDIYIAEKLFLTPSVEVTYYTSEYTDYYFGVSGSEAARNSKIKRSYSAGGAYTYGVSLDLTYSLNEKTMLGASIGVMKYSGEIGDSPIVDRSTSISGGLTVMYFIY